MKLTEWGDYIIFKFEKAEINAPNRAMYRFVESMKKRISPEFRDYREDNQEWWIDNDEKYQTILAELMAKYFGDA